LKKIMADVSKKDDCIFCKIVNGGLKSDIVRTGKNFIAVKDISPFAEGHTLILPKQHYSTMLDIPNGLGGEMLQFVKEVVSDLTKKNLGTGFNIISNNFKSAGQVVMHAHIHVIPRKDGDGIRYFSKD
jgi:histidine triad (HIT) family protein